MRNKLYIVLLGTLLISTLALFFGAAPHASAATSAVTQNTVVSTTIQKGHHQWTRGYRDGARDARRECLAEGKMGRPHQRARVVPGESDYDKGYAAGYNYISAYDPVCTRLIKK